jgi:HK97 family phage portal protein
MGIVDNFIEKKLEPIKNELKDVQEENKSLKSVEKDLNTQIYQLQNIKAPDMKASEFIKQYREWVYANCNVIAKAVSKIQFRLYQLKKDDDVEEIKEHPLLELLYRMNPYMNKDEVIYTEKLHELLIGDAAWYLARNNRENPKEVPMEIWPLRSDWLSIKQGELEKGGGFIAYYVYKIPGQEEKIFLPHEILLIKRPNPEDPYRGLSVIRAAAVTVDIDNFATNWNRNFFWNSARPDAVLHTEQRLSDEVISRLKNQFRSEYGGLSNSMKMMVLENGLDYKPFQSTVKDMDFLEQQKWSRDKMIAMFGNTKMALGITEDVNRANADVGEYIQEKKTTEPEMQTLVNYLNEYLVPLYGDNLFLSFVSTVPESQELMNDELDRLTNKVYTVNESRAKKGLEPLEGGDVLYLPLNLVPMDANAGQNNSQKSYVELKSKIKGTGYRSRLPRKDFGEEIQRLKNRNYKKRAMRAAIREQENEIKKEMLKLLRKHKKEQKIAKKRENFWKGLIANSDLYEPKIERIVIDKIYPYVSANVQQKLNENIKSLKTKDVDVNELMFDKSEAVVFSIGEFNAIFNEIVVQQGNKAFEYLGLKETFKVDAVIAKEIKRNITKFSKSMFNTITDKLTDSLNEGLAKGEGLPKLTSRVKQEIDDLKTYQAKRIARTEVSRSTNYANGKVWKQAGFAKEEWLTALDERVCEFCGIMEGKITKINENYFDKDSEMTGSEGGKLDFTYENVKHPPLHVSCRCTTTPVKD